MEKRMIVAIALSMVVLLGFQFLGPKKNTVQQQLLETSVEANEPTARAFAEDTPISTRDSRSMDPAAAAEKALEEETIIETRHQTFVFSDIGGNIKKISLKEFQTDGKEEILFEEEDPAMGMLAVRSDLLSGMKNRKFKRTEGDNFLGYNLTEPDWAEVTKRYIFDKSSDCMKIEISIKNISPRQMTVALEVRGPSNLKGETKIAGRQFTEANIKIDEKIWKTRRAKVPQKKAGEISWTALKNRYFTVMLKPLTPLEAVTIYQQTANKLSIGLNNHRQVLAPGETAKTEYLLYAGSLNEKRLGEIGYDMQEVVSYGFFGGVSKVLLSILRFFQQGVKSWGLAIILLTLLINVVMFPLTYKSFSSMQQVKRIQPHIQKLRALHKDNPQKLQKETMELYRKYNVNPLGGCLPMVLQMPIFISLYQGLMRSIELKGAHFLWIKDLARPDAVPLPFSLPMIGNHINILPILMAGVMFLQQKVSGPVGGGAGTDSQARQQKNMMLFMPLFFGFLFYKMPSGLVLYWLTNTILMTAEQSFISKRMHAEV